jgi:hypothetical protein
MMCLRRKPKRMARIMAELDKAAGLPPLPDSSQAGAEVPDERLSECWLGLYRGYIDYVSGGNELSFAHLENLNSVESAAESFRERIDSNPELARKAGGIVELDRVLGKLMANEYRKIGSELERRENVLEEALAECETFDVLERRESLENLLGAADEVIRLKKLSNSSGLEGLVELRSAIRTRRQKKRLS